MSHGGRFPKMAPAASQKGYGGRPEQGPMTVLRHRARLGISKWGKGNSKSRSVSLESGRQLISKDKNL